MSDMTKEEAIQHLEEMKKGIFLWDTSELIEVCISALSADVRPNIHARWESDGHGHIICTACKGAKLNTHRSKFCDSCGAIMDGKRQCKRCIYHKENGCTRWVCIDAETKGEKGTE